MRNLAVFTGLLFLVTLFLLLEACRAEESVESVRVVAVDRDAEFRRFLEANTPPPPTTVVQRTQWRAGQHNATKTTAPTARYAGSVPDAIRSGFARFGPAVAEQAVRVAACETGRTFDPGARNGAHLGLFQISRTYHLGRVERMGFRWEQMAEVEPNIAVAAALYGEQGWGPWTCRTAA